MIELWSKDIIILLIKLLVCRWLDRFSFIDKENTICIMNIICPVLDAKNLENLSFEDAITELESIVLKLEEEIRILIPWFQNSVKAIY